MPRLARDVAVVSPEIPPPTTMTCSFSFVSMPPVPAETESVANPDSSGSSYQLGMSAFYLSTDTSDECLVTE